MTTHISVLPTDILDVVTTQVNDQPRFLRLPHPRTGVPSLFLPGKRRETDDSLNGILEVHAIAPPNPRSWFMDDQVVEEGKLLLMTPVDPVFLLIPIVRAISKEGAPANFRPLDDIFDDAVTALMSRNRKITSPDQQISRHDIVKFTSMKCAAAAMKHLCEVKEVTPEISVYRFSMQILVGYLKKKVTRLIAANDFRESLTVVRLLARDGLMEDGEESLLEAGRLKAACDLVAHHLPPDVKTELMSAYDFSALDIHVKIVQEELVAMAVVEVDKGKKKVTKASKATTTKATPQEGTSKKRKIKESHGVEVLKKVNTEGMQRISTFFQKKPKA
ncbi:hypothetical protein BDM02DRAFT_3088479 [Thelephora ganbajun]|uniref:Uncharacterized protein n=1 Tax=Thelephora ganbajun TaxID=370292 RepID=A0ACB6ZT48_THEGA|nr:hypothetical protein BDM02DRAFT_3088479 [Thelephora ganbajun]